MAFISMPREWVLRRLPEGVKEWIWYLTDKRYRQRCQAQRKRIHRFREARRKAFPLIWSQTGGVVASGPFAGMKYLRPLENSYFTPKLLGTYEKELSSIIEEICQSTYHTIIDIGAAEGYFVCGFARRIKRANVKAFEASEKLHSQLSELASLNEVRDQIEIFGICTPDQLRHHLNDTVDCFLICDVDGAEWELLDPQEIPSLSKIDILVEMHDCLRPGVTEVIRSRFSATHTIEHINQRPRTAEDLPIGVELECDLAIKAMDECRASANDWLWMKCVVS